MLLLVYCTVMVSLIKYIVRMHFSFILKHFSLLNIKEKSDLAMHVRVSETIPVFILEHQQREGRSKFKG